MSHTCRVKYTDTTLPTGTNTYRLFNTQTTAAASNFFQHACVKKVNIKLYNSQAGTLNAYKSDDAGTTWTQIDTVAVAAVASNDVNEYEWNVEGYLDWKAEWVNGGTVQATFAPDISLIPDRAAQ